VFGTVPSQDVPTPLAGYVVHDDPSPTPSINTESRNGNDNLCSGLPAVADYGGSP
jgi:hypothetical protein